VNPVGGENLDGSPNVDDEGNEVVALGIVGIILNSAAMRDSRLSEALAAPILERAETGAERGVVGGDNEAICEVDATTDEETLTGNPIGLFAEDTCGGCCGDVD
jgi:hypothetical protein